MLVQRAVQSIEQLLGAIKQTGAMEVLRKLVGRRRSLVGRQVGTIEQVLMHADRAIDLALAAKERSESKVQIDRLRIDFHDVDERFDRFVGLLVQQKIEAAKIRQRQSTRLAQQVLDIDARGDPAQRKKHRDNRQKPPQLEIHCGD